MAWIPAPHPEECEPELAEELRANADPSTGLVDEILRVHALDPRGLRAHLGVYEAAMRGSETILGGGFLRTWAAACW